MTSPTPQTPTAGAPAPLTPYVRPRFIAKTRTPSMITPVGGVAPEQPAANPQRKLVIAGVVVAVIAVVGVVSAAIFSSVRQANNITPEDAYAVFSENLDAIAELEIFYENISWENVSLSWAFSQEHKKIVEDGIASIRVLNDAINSKEANLLPESAREPYIVTQGLLADRMSSYERTAEAYNAIYELASERKEENFLAVYNDSAFADVKEAMDYTYQIYSYPLGSEDEEWYMSVYGEQTAKIFATSANNIFNADSPQYLFASMQDVINNYASEVQQ